VLPDAELDDYVRSLALELAANAPLTIARRSRSSTH